MATFDIVPGIMENPSSSGNAIVVWLCTVTTIPVSGCCCFCLLVNTIPVYGCCCYCLLVNTILFPVVVIIVYVLRIYLFPVGLLLFNNITIVVSGCSCYCLFVKYNSNFRLFLLLFIYYHYTCFRLSLFIY